MTTRNLPQEISDNTAALYLPGTSGNHVTATDSTAFAITDLDVRLWIALTDWTPVGTTNPIGQWNSTGNQRGWQLQIGTNGRVGVIWSTDGTYNPGTTYFFEEVETAPTVGDGEFLGIRLTLDVDNGAGGRDTRVYTRADPEIEASTGWTQLGSTKTVAATTTIHNSTSTLDLGAVANGGLLAGRIGRAVLLDGIDGTVVASPDFRTAGGPRYRDEQGNVWTINGSAWAWSK